MTFFLTYGHLPFISFFILHALNFSVQFIVADPTFAKSFDISQEADSAQSIIMNLANSIMTLSAVISACSIISKTTTFALLIDSLSKSVVVTKLLSLSMGQLTLAMIGITALILLVTKFDDLSLAMKGFLAAVVVLTVAIWAFNVATGTAAVAIAAFMIPVAAAIALFCGLLALFGDSSVSEYSKQLKADTEAIEGQTDALKEQISTYEELEAKRQDSTYAILAEADMNQNLLDKITELNGEENKSTEQKTTLKDLVEQFNDATGMSIELTQESNALSPETISLMQTEIENVKARALAEVVATELKEQYTQALRASNQIKSDEIDMEALLDGRSADQLRGAEKDKYDALQESLEAAQELRNNANTQVESLEDLHTLALTGGQDEFLSQYMEFTGVVVDTATQSAYTREEINGMMLDTMSTQDKEQYAQKLLDLQANGANLADLLDENGKLIIDENGNIGSNAAAALSTGYKDATTENQDDIAAANQETIDTTKDNYQIASPSKVFEGFGKNIVEGLNNGVTGNQETTNTALSGWGSVISGWFQGLSLPKMSVDIEYVAPSSKILQAAIDFLNLPGIPKLKINKYALGGIPDFGELFVAREAGPELVGRFGNMTAVMNNGQIVEAVAGGVYSAVSAAMAGNNSSEQPLNVTLKVGETDFGKIVVNSINSLSRVQGSVNLAV